MLQAESKISSMSRRFLTPDQKLVFNRYREQYKHMRERYRADFDYRIKTDLGLLLLTGAILAVAAFCLIVYLIYKLNTL